MTGKRRKKPDEPGALTEHLAELARQAGGTLHLYPRPGRAVGQVVLRDLSDDRGSQYEAAQVEDDGTLRVTGHDQGLAVSEAFGRGISSYEWVWVVAPGRVAGLVRLLGGNDGDDVLAVLLAYHERTGGRVSDVMRHADVAAEFSSWHS
ncbi:MAG TPA: hypothetical protein VMR14_10915 [Streptosporangiaceae bacterium]|jgi:hypothetical protein|nr:hypothetical protein [Streptosporangiaceae bacterium]